MNKQKPNVLLISTDHWPGRLLQSVGYKHVLTPTLIVVFAFCNVFHCMGQESVSEILPLTVGEAIIPRGTPNDWEATGLDGTEASVPRAFALDFDHPTGEQKARAVVSRDYDNLPVGDFDQLVWYISKTGPDFFATLKATTDKGTFSSEPVEITGPFPDQSVADLVVDLEGAEFIKSISLECVVTENTRDRVRLNRPRLMLRNKNEFQAWLNHWKRFDDIKWEGLIQDESYTPSFKPSYGMMFANEALEEWREKYIDELSTDSYAAPEGAITPSGRRGRGWEHERRIDSGAGLGRSTTIAFQAMVLRDKELMRLAARYLLSVCAAETWTTHVPYPKPIGDTYEASFRPSSTGYNLALALDWAGEMLTPRGRDYVLKQLMKKAFMPITYSLWYRPAFGSNQGVSFIRGKLAFLLIAERHWERVRPYTDLAKADLDECVSNMFRNDGSYMEASSGYIDYTIACMAPAYQSFASMRDEDLADIVPEGVSKSGAFAEIIASTSKHPDRIFIPVGCSARMSNIPASRLVFMALACPESMWVNLFNRLDDEEIEEAKKDSWAGRGLIFSQLYKQATGLDEVMPESLIILKQAGLLSSLRASTKIVLIGDAVGVGKKDHDVGSFVLEYEGDIYAMDMPGRPASRFLSAQYHNMLVALDEHGEPVDSILYTRIRPREDRDAMRPEATGDAEKFRGTVNASKSWAPEHLKKWIRTIDSPNPDKLTITDDYIIGENASGAAFTWVTFLPSAVDGNKITITGEYGSTCEITAPPDTEIKLEKFFPGSVVTKQMSLPEGHECTRIMITKPGNPGDEGKMEVKVRLLSAED